MAELHVNIDGDCSGLIAATDRAKAAIDSMDGTRANASFELQGVDRAIGDLGRVADARESAGGTVTVGVDSGSIGQAREDLSGLRGDVRAASRDFEAASGLRTFGFSDDGSIRQLSGDLGGVTRGLQSVGVESGSLSRVQAGLNVTAGSARQLDSDMGSAARSASSLGASAAQVDQNVSQMGRSLVSVGAQTTSSLDGATAAMQRSAAGSVQVSSGFQGISMAGADAGANMESTASAVAKVDKALNSAGGSVDSTTAGVGKLSTALSGSATGGGNSGLIADIVKMNSVSASSPFGGPGLTNAGSMSETLGSTLPGVRGVGTPVSFIGSGGGGGGGGIPIGPFGGGGPPGGPPGGGGPPFPGGDWADGPRPGWTGGRGNSTFGALKGNDPLPKMDLGAGASAFEGTMGLAGPLMIGGLVGVAAAAVTAAVGAGSVMETVKHLPAAMSAATQATNQFGKALTNTVAGASVDKSVFSELGQALHGLGSEVGTIGLQNMNATIGGVASVVGTATSALKTMEPAITPSINAMTALGNAVINGIASPGVVAGILGVDRALSDPANEQGISSLISGALQVATIVGQVAVDVAGSVGNVVSNVAGVVSSVTGAAGLGGISPGDALPSVLAGGAAAIAGGAKGGVGGAALWAGVASAVTGLAQYQVDQGQSPLDALSTGLSAGLLAKTLGKGTALGKTPVAAGIGVGADLLTTALAQIPGQGGVDASNMMADVTNYAQLGSILGMPFGPEGSLIGAAGGALVGGGKGIYDAMYPSAGGGAAGTASAQPGPGQFPGRAGMDAANQAAKAAQQKAAAPGATAADQTAAAQATAAAQQTSQATSGGKYGWNMDAAGTLTPSNAPGGGGGVYAGGPGTGGSGFGSVSGPLGSATNPLPPSAPAPLAGSQRIAGSDSSTLPAGMGGPVGATIPTGPGFGSLVNPLDTSFGAPKTQPPPSAGGAAAPPAPFSTTGGPPAAVVPLSGGAAVLPPGSPLNAGVGATGTPGAGTLPPPPPKPVTTAPMGGGQGAGTSFGSLNPAQVAGLNAVLPPLAAHLAAVAPAATQMSSGLQTSAPATAQLSSGLAKVQQSAAAVAPPMQQAGQHAVTATAQMQSMQQQAPAVVSAVKAVAPAATAALGQAQQQVAAAAPSVGAAAPAGVAAGINANASQPCDAANKMNKALVNCGNNSLGTSSPSKKFMYMGESTGQGLAIGITSSMPGAMAAVKAAMGDVVAAGQAGLAAASPSKEFQAMGSQAMSNVATGATSASSAGAAAQQQQQRSEEQQRADTLRQMNAANMPQKQLTDAQKQQADEAAARAQGLSPDAKDDAAYKRMLQGRGLSPATQDRLMGEHTAHRDLQRKQQAAKDTAQKTAMERLGWKGYDPANPESPHNQRKDQLEKDRDKSHTDTRGKVDSRDPTFRPGDDPYSHTGGGKEDAFLAAKARGELGLEAVRTGRTPQQILNDKTNAALGAGPDTGDRTGGGLGKGIDKGSPGAANASGKAVDGAINEAKKKAKAHSPSQVFFDIGGDLMSGLSNGINAGGGAVAASVSDTMSGALGSGVTVASNGVLGIASNTGLQVGYQWARGVASGADSVLKSADFSQLSLPQIGSALAKTALGAGGMLGPAGSGGSIPNHLTVTMGAGTPAAPPIVNTYVSIDGTQLRAMTRTEIESVLNVLADSIPQQVG